MLQIAVTLTYDYRGIIYDGNIFKIEATNCSVLSVKASLPE